MKPISRTETKETAGAATLTVSRNPTHLERILTMNMGHQQTNIKNDVAKVTGILDDLCKIGNLLMLIQIATEGMKTKESNAISEAVCIAMERLWCAEASLVKINEVAA